MTYNDNYASKPVVDQPTMLYSLEMTFAERMTHQSDLIEDIRNKLHQILNKRAETKMEHNESHTDDDVNSRLSRQLSRLADNNMSLEKIINHLSEII